MHAQGQKMILGVQPEEAAAEQGAAAQVELPEGFFAGQPPRDGAAVRRLQGVEVDDRQLAPTRRRHHLDRFFPLGPEGRPQGLVAAHDLAQAVLQKCRSERASEMKGRHHVEEDRAFFELVDEPQPALGEGQR